jgi:acyl-CoA thioester hydrolase
MKQQLKLRIIYADTDAEGVVYYANYLKFFERGRMELLREMGMPAQGLREEKGIVFAISRVECDYKAPAVLDDEITVVTEIIETTGATMIFKQEVLRGEKLLVSAKITAVAIDAKSFKPRKIPEAFLSH